MGPTNGINLERVKYFNLNDYVSRIDLSSEILEHAYETSNKFDEYIRYLSQYKESVIVEHLINSFYNEVEYTNRTERHLIRPQDIKENDVFFDSLSMSHERIKQLHHFVSGDQDNFSYDYRKTEARVSYFDKLGEEHIFWYGAEPEDIEKFMKDFISIYQRNSIKDIHRNPFLKSALCHLLFVRIHPFNDGNGRTARLIYDMKFTKMINNIYGTNLKISPLHISMSIFTNQPTYVRRIDNTYFDIEHDCNDEINKFFDFLLYMTDDQIGYMMNDNSKEALDNLANYYANLHNETIDERNKEAASMKVRKLINSEKKLSDN